MNLTEIEHKHLDKSTLEDKQFVIDGLCETLGIESFKAERWTILEVLSVIETLRSFASNLEAIE